MRFLFTLILCLLLTSLAFAQEESPTPYEIALQKIEWTRTSHFDDLYLNDLGLTELPPEISHLVNLRRLFLFNNQLQTLPPEIGQLTNLEHLDLSFNQIENLPSEFWQLPKLNWIYLQSNQLQSLPPEIENLRSLVFLDLENNQLESIPPEIGNLPILQLLNLASNRLTTLPDALGNNDTLCLLDLRNNQIQYLPINLSQISSLREPNCGEPNATLLLDGNPLTSPPPEVIAQGTSAILDYLQNPLLWHLRRFVLNWAAATGGILALFVALSWRYKLSKKKKRE